MDNLRKRVKDYENGLTSGSERITGGDGGLAGIRLSGGTGDTTRVRSYLNRAHARGIVERNVIALCAVPHGKGGRPSKALTLEQAKEVLTRTKADPLHAYIVVSLLTGARTEEMRALTWPNMHLASEPQADPPVVPYMQI